MSAGRLAVQPAIKREPESARGRKHGITEATDIPLTVPLSATEKGTLSHRKPPMTVEAARPQSWGVARLSFGMPKMSDEPPSHPKNLAPLPSGGNPLPIVADCEKPN